MGAAYLIVFLSGVGLFVCTPIAFICGWIARRFGADEESAFAIVAAKSFLMPWAIIMGMIFLACLTTGLDPGG